jgi:hypothetical protein
MLFILAITLPTTFNKDGVVSMRGVVMFREFGWVEKGLEADGTEVGLLG